MYRGVLIMNKNLPNVYAVPISKKIENNKETFQSKEEEQVQTNQESISVADVNKIFSSKNHVYKTRILLITKEGTKEVDAVGLTNNAILTLKGETIPLSDILDIKKV